MFIFDHQFNEGLVNYTIMKNQVTAQSVKVRMSDYTRYSGVFAENVNQKINLRANILSCGTPDNSRLRYNSPSKKN